MPLVGLGARVSKGQVSSLLLARAPGILDDSGPDFLLFEETVRGVTTEVVPLVGSDPDASPKRDLAVWAITMGVAAQLEASLFPEQQGLGDQGRAVYLDRRYQSLLRMLTNWRTEPPGEGQAPPSGSSRASFPPTVPAYPDPARGTPSRGYVEFGPGAC